MERDLGILYRMVEVNGIKMHVAEKGEGPLVLLLHGFPKLWYTWCHQIASFATYGYHAIAPDLCSYGDTNVPPDVASYNIFHLVALGDALVLRYFMIKFGGYVVTNDPTVIRSSDRLSNSVLWSRIHPVRGTFNSAGRQRAHPYSESLHIQRVWSVLGGYRVINRLMSGSMNEFSSWPLGARDVV